MDTQIETKVWPFSDIGNRVESAFEIWRMFVMNYMRLERMSILKFRKNNNYKFLVTLVTVDDFENFGNFSLDFGEYEDSILNCCCICCQLSNHLSN